MRRRERALFRAGATAALAVLGLACSGTDLDLSSTERALSVADCPAGSNIIEGTDGPDVLRGTNGVDCILGYGGDDELIGRRGDDFLVGGDGDDVLDGSAGNDTLYGEAGEDLLLGGNGNDVLSGDGDSDVLDGEGDSDVAQAGDGNDAVSPETESADGGNGFDICIGTSCESSAYRSCRKDDDCLPDGRCLHGVACVSCQGEDSCRGTLDVIVGVEEGCAAGFELNNQGVCGDVDECADGVDDCDPVATCTNEVGGYQCSCPPTHRGDGVGPSGCDARVAELRAGGAHTCARLVDGRVKCWGSNEHGQLGLGDTENRGDDAGEMGDALQSVDLGRGAPAVELAAGTAFNCARLDDGTAVCWGQGSSGQLGTGSTDDRGDDPNEMGAALVPVDVGGAVTSLSAGGNHACASRDDGTIRCWGGNAAGQLGLGDTQARGDQPGEMGGRLPAVDVGPAGLGSAVFAAVGDASCALRGDGSLACWGSGAHGLAGQGDTLDRGDEPGEMGAALVPVPFGTSNAISQVRVAEHACVAFDAGNVRCWGRNDRGQLGYGDMNARGDEPGEMGPALDDVELAAPVVELFASATGGCAELTNGAVKCWGDNEHGALGLGDTDHRGDEPGEMGPALPVVDFGQLQAPIQIVGGAHHHCALFADGGVKCWGAGDLGQHGLETSADIGDEPGEMGDALPFVTIGH